MSYQNLIKMREKILDYLREQKSINEDALLAYDNQLMEQDPEIRRMREREAIKLRDRIYELKRHIEVIKKMYPDVDSGKSK